MIKYIFAALLLILVSFQFTDFETKGEINLTTSIENIEEFDEPAPQNAGILEPIDWTSSVEQDGENVVLKFTAKLDKGWHLYSQFLDPEKMGPIPTSFSIPKSSDYEIVGKVKEPKPKVEYDPNFDMDLGFFSDKVTFRQKIKVNSSKDFSIKAEVEFMVCDDKRCLPPEFMEFEFKIKGIEQETDSEGNDDKTDKKEGDDENQVEGDEEEVDSLEGDKKSDISTKKLDEEKLKEIIPSLPNIDLENPINSCGDSASKDIRNLWLVFFFGFSGGLLALLTPCVFPMIPLTVSFFTKGSENSGKKGIFRAALYGFFIFAIYALLSIPFHFNTDPEVLNEIATSVWLNIIFFVVFVVFAISFFGYFEITIPSGLTNKANKASNIGGVLGIFFMAITLALVSFSCTGPILGTVLGNALKNGPWPITAAMSGFGIALGLPFALFAAFPSFMNKLPKSGGWLNSVKVVLGFLELALAIKFLSNADLVEQWGLIKRETFFLSWIIIGIGLFAYLMGWLKFPHDSPTKKKPSLFKIGFIALVGAFTIYIAPGVMKNPVWNHNLLSGFPPPGFYSWYDKDSFHSEYTDFETAVEIAKKENKPILIDFTGWACVNCRKMEETVWTVNKIKERLRDDYILVSLYVDDKVELPEELQGVFEFDINGKIKKKRIKTIGNKWATFQTQVFNNNSQPYYVALSPDGYLLSNPVGYMPNDEDYYDWLNCGLDAFEKLKKGEVSTKKSENVKKEQPENGILEPVEWDYKVKPTSNKNEYEVKIIAHLDKGWHIYSQDLEGATGPIPTTITFDENENYELIGKTKENKPKTEYDPNFDMDLKYFDGKAVFTQKILVKETPIKLKGNTYFMLCDDEKCLPPTEEFFEIEIK